jgi:hypothetical protein
MNIPGYYYDTEKRRYFKVESSGTAPAAAVWSSGNVKRQKLCDEQAATASRHLDLAKSRIKRARVLHEPLTGGFFAREYGAADDAMQAACFVKSLHNKGRISLLREGRLAGQIAQIRCMYIGAHDYKTGMCIAYVGMYVSNRLDTFLSFFLPLATYTKILFCRLRSTQRVRVILNVHPQRQC